MSLCFDRSEHLVANSPSHLVEFLISSNYQATDFYAFQV